MPSGSEVPFPCYLCPGSIPLSVVLRLRSCWIGIRTGSFYWGKASTPRESTHWPWGKERERERERDREEWRKGEMWRNEDDPCNNNNPVHTYVWQLVCIRFTFIVFIGYPHCMTGELIQGYLSVTCHGKNDHTFIKCTSTCVYSPCIVCISCVDGTYILKHNGVSIV